MVQHVFPAFRFNDVKKIPVPTKVCHFLTRKLIISIPLLALIAYAIVPVAKKIPNGFLPSLIIPLSSQRWSRGSSSSSPWGKPG